MNYLQIKYSKSGLALLCLILFQSAFIYAQDKIKWISFEQAQELMKKDKKKIIVDVYTDWCGWCKRMDATTFQDPNVIKVINKSYYAVKFNAEQKEDINFKSKVFKFVPQGNRGYHELAIEITKGQLSYPTFVFIDENFNTIQPIPGYQQATDFEAIANYFGGNFYKSTPWNTYRESYSPSK